MHICPVLTMPAYTLAVHLVAKPDDASLKKLTAKLQEASQVYSNDKECLSWLVEAALMSVGAAILNTP